MTPYERGYAAALKAAAELCKLTADRLPPGPFTGFSAETLQSAEQRILSLPIQGEATNAGTNATQPVAESQAPAPSEPGDRGVAPTLADSRPARSGPSQECVSDLSERLRQYADIADAGGKAHWANAMREAMYTLAVYRQNAAKEEHDAHR